MSDVIDTPKSVRRLLVANRGEIAGRVFATCDRLGIETVAVHSDADADLPFVTSATYAVRLPGDAPSETYLRADLIIDAARRTGADAVHPGYGFLSENADFAQAVIEAGLTWIGPSPEAIRAMGSKVGAKEIMRRAGVPVLEAPETPTADDLPLLVKASAGGGGRGMRIVRDLAALADEIAIAASEAESAFGDGTVFVEPYVERGRHVEVQVCGDRDGTNISILGARDCSVQRRHQKVIEEAPPPHVDDQTLRAMYDAARAAASAINYSGAGTVEFLLDAADLDANNLARDRGEQPGPARFWFLEMNTRLQVEHPVTEAVTGLDLVALQLRAATDPDGFLIGFSASGPEVDPTFADGHAIEARLYAEDASFTPQSGHLSALEFADDVRFVGGRVNGPVGVRVDAGFASGTEVSTYYDAMLAKVIAWAPTREEAIVRLTTALRGARIHGIRTNRDQLVQILSSPEFAAMEVGTTWLEAAELSPNADDPWLATAAALALVAADADERTVQQGIPIGWRNVTSQPQRSVFERDGEEITVDWWGTRDGVVVDGATVVEATPTRVRLEVDRVMRTYAIATTRGPNSVPGGLAPREVWIDGPVVSACLREVPRFTDPAAQLRAGSLRAPMPGVVARVIASAGSSVAAGDPVLVLEAMKMQHTITAPADGVVAELPVTTGQQVAAGDILAVVSDAPTPADSTPIDIQTQEGAPS